MKAFVLTLLALGVLLLLVNMTLAQSWIPYVMGPGEQVLNMATRPRPVAAATPAVPEVGYGAMVGERRLVCEQWNGTRWVVIPVTAKECIQ